jgi:hypothetical protein
MKSIRKRKLSPVQAIKENCYECSGRLLKEVKRCIITDCPLYPFRLGANPNRKTSPTRKSS